MRFWTGTSGFQYAEWKGGFYPEKMPVAKMLPFYAEHFPSTEINYSFRQIPSAKTIANWHAATPEDFRFTFKAPQQITHFARLKNCAKTLSEFHAAIAPMGEKLGVVLFQLPPNFQQDSVLLAEFLEGLPKGLRAAFEFRHPSWFDDGIYEIMRAHDVALCVAEDEDLTTPSEATASFGYLRLRRPDYTAADLSTRAKWVARQKTWKDAFLYFKHEDTGTGPMWAAEMMELLGG